jgi:hypothetical protein
MLSRDQIAGIAGNDEEVQFKVTNPVVIMIQPSAQEISYRFNNWPGDQTAEQEVDVAVWTNGNTWHVTCEASPLQGTRREIPPSRIQWERLDSSGQVEASGNLGTRATLLEGQGPVEGAQWTLRFVLSVSMSDLAGDYSGGISLTGFAEGPDIDVIHDLELGE